MKNGAPLARTRFVLLDVAVAPRYKSERQAQGADHRYSEIETMIRTRRSGQVRNRSGPRQCDSGRTAIPISARVVCSGSPNRSRDCNLSFKICAGYSQAAFLSIRLHVVILTTYGHPEITVYDARAVEQTPLVNVTLVISMVKKFPVFAPWHRSSGARTRVGGGL
jgi:hypothetical protein